MCIWTYPSPSTAFRLSCNSGRACRPFTTARIFLCNNIGKRRQGIADGVFIRGTEDAMQGAQRSGDRHLDVPERPART